MKTRLLSCLLASAVFLTCFAGCGKNKDPEKVTSSNTTSSSDVSSDNISSDNISSDVSSENTSSDSFEIVSSVSDNSSAKQPSNPSTSSLTETAKPVDNGSPTAAKYANSKRLNLLNGNNEFEYSIVYPANMATDQLASARNVYRAANKISADIPKYQPDDSVAANSSSKEILIGLTNRAESEAMRNKLLNNRSNNFYDYIIAVSGNKIIIDATSAEVLQEAVKFFNTTFLSEDGEHTIPEDYLFIRAEDASTSMKIAGKDVSQYVIVCGETPSAMVYKSLEELQAAIKDKTDYTVPIIKTNNSSAYKDKITAVVSGNDANAYSISLDNTDLKINGGHNYSLSAAIHALAGNINNVSADSAFNIPKNYSYKGTYSNKTATTGSYHLVFSDEFNGSSLNTDDWSVEDYNYGSGIKAQGGIDLGNKASNVAVKDGLLHLNATIEKTPDGNKYWGAQIYTNKNFQFGLFEIRAKVNSGIGIWPSFWANSYNTLEKNYGAEIDVFEFFGSDKNCVSNMHSWWTAGRNILGHVSTDSQLASGHIQHLNSEDGNRYALPSGAGYSEDFHTFACEWTPEYLKFYVDGYNYCTQPITSFLKDPNYGYSMNEFMFFLNKSVYIKLATSVGVKEVTKPEDVDKLTDSTYYIDWIHLYQMDGVGSYGETF